MIPFRARARRHPQCRFSPATSEVLESRTLLSAGDLDRSFSGDGQLLIPDTVYARRNNDVAVQTDGKVLVAGSRTLEPSWDSGRSEILLTRYNVDGTPDATFGSGGSVLTNLGGAAWGVAVKVAGDGKIVVGAAGRNAAGEIGWAALRLLPGGAPDTTFGVGGTTFLKLKSGNSSGIADMDLAPGGKVVLAGSTDAGEFTVARLTAAGRLDTAFGGDGIATADFGPGREVSLRGVAVLDDGRVVAGGTVSIPPDPIVNTDVLVARFTEAGGLDPAFDGDGWVRAGGSGWETASGVAVDASDRVYVAGENPDGPAVWRFTASGAADTSFGGDGVATLPAPAQHWRFDNLALAPGGKVVASGSISGPAGVDVLVARFTAGGLVDSTFNTTGFVQTDFYKDHDRALGVAVAPGGKVVAAGEVTAGTISGTIMVGDAVVRYNDDGTPDSSFGNGGKSAVTFEGARRSVSSVIVQPDRKIVVGGTTVTGPRHDFFVARYNPDGTLDPTFERDGRAVTDFGNGRADGVSRLLLQPDGKIVAVGMSIAGQDRDIALARYNPDGSLDAAFGQGGRVVTNFGTEDLVGDVAAYPGGRIVVGSENRVVRYTSSGALDTTFAGDGSLEVNTTGGTVKTILVQGDKLLVDRTVRVERYHADGSPDRTFASPELPPGTETNGEDDEDAYSYITRMRLAPDGDVIVLGHLHEHVEETERITLWRLNPDGTIDAAWGRNGQVVTYLDYLYDLYETGLAVQPDGKVVVTANGEDYYFAGERIGVVLRYDADGSTDEMFGQDGVAHVRNDLRLNSVALDPAGDVVAAGTFNIWPQNGWGLVRIDGTGTEGSARHDRSTGVVTVLGEAGDDNITLNVSRGRLFVNFNGTPYSFPLTSVRRVLVYGRHGNDTIRIATPVPGLRVSGGDGDDVLRGGPGGESLDGGDGNDTVDGGLGADTLGGGGGSDTLDYRSRTRPLLVRQWGASGEAGEGDSISGGFERIYGGSGDDHISLQYGVQGAAYGGAGNDTLAGSTGADALWGEAGDDLLLTSYGADYFRGGDGNDTVDYAGGNAVVVTIDGKPDDGYVYQGGTSEGDNVNTDVENVVGSGYADHVTGSSANNRLEGGGGNDTLLGLAGDDTLLGGAGDDVLADTQGNNTLDGGADTDTVNGVTESRQPVTYEAEDAGMSGARPANMNPGYTGTGYADFANADGDLLVWSFDSPSAGRRTLTFRYANGALSDRPLQLMVNNVVINDRLSFVSTGSWSTWGTVQVEVDLNAGWNWVRLMSVGNNGGNIDSLTVA
jgi:uncharacterized delta-60 repeat protein